MSERPFDALRRVLHDISQKLETDNDPTPKRTRLDTMRRRRTGTPEIILARSKSSEEVVESLRILANADGRALATRCRPDTIEVVVRELAGEYQVEVAAEASAVVVARLECPRLDTGGRIAVISAGSSDGPVAAEAVLVAREMGVTVDEVRDVGVAGLHRLVAPLERVVEAGADAIVVAAGMDGALPSVVAGLVAVPVIGLPTSTGYGYGGEGVAALMAMLQSCAPGLVVVNVDNGVGAGATAALIANRVAAARTSGRERGQP
jgi:pyridinium-3,5-biscarboxylic acid mononucleotide synthase